MNRGRHQRLLCKVVRERRGHAVFALPWNEVWTAAIAHGLRLQSLASIHDVIIPRRKQAWITGYGRARNTADKLAVAPVTDLSPPVLTTTHPLSATPHKEQGSIKALGHQSLPSCPFILDTCIASLPGPLPAPTFLETLTRWVCFGPPASLAQATDVMCKHQAPDSPHIQSTAESACDARRPTVHTACVQLGAPHKHSVGDGCL